MLVFCLGQSSEALQLLRRAAGQRSGQRSPSPSGLALLLCLSHPLNLQAFSPQARVTGKIRLSNTSTSCLSFTSLPAQAESSSPPATPQPCCSWPADKEGSHWYFTGSQTICPERTLVSVMLSTHRSPTSHSFLLVYRRGN